MFSKDIRMRALEVYSATGSISQTIQQMGNCFSRQTLYQWIAQQHSSPSQRKKKVLLNTASHPAIPTAEFKLKVIKRCFEKGEMVKAVVPVDLNGTELLSIKITGTKKPGAQIGMDEIAFIP